MISYEEFSKGLKDSGYEASEQQIIEIIQNIHQDCEGLDPKDQQINYTEFMAYTIDAKKMTSLANLQNIFTQFDTDYKQYFTKKDLEQFLARKGRKMPTNVIEEMINEVDLDKNGKVDFEEFVRIMSCLLYTSPSPRDRQKSRMPSSA
eukprot:TRINITY_DN11115_c0_g1_i1.p4 TRINITY_DN11115_c0_g1~~TRINITY_DN11115_c0_g1_i1.p4  ORF type:complete len:148 (-),score=39.92 TRINITY_DN11115_c0_g1_i1:30-473(-)